MWLVDVYIIKVTLGQLINAIREIMIKWKIKALCILLLV